MSKSAPSGRAKRSRSVGSNTTTEQPTVSTLTTTPLISADQRRAMIAENAYLRAAARGFRGGDPVADWLASERDVDALLSNGHNDVRATRNSP